MPDDKPLKELTLLQMALCEQHMQGGRLDEQAKAAGYKGKNLRQIAWNELNTPHVRAHLDTLRAQYREELGIETTRVLQELSNIAFADLGDLCEWREGGVEVLDSTKLTRDKRAAVKEVAYHFSDGAGTVKLRLHDKVAALAKLCDHLGIKAPEKSEVDHTGKIELIIQDYSSSATRKP